MSIIYRVANWMGISRAGGLINSVDGVDGIVMGQEAITGNRKQWRGDCVGDHESLKLIEYFGMWNLLCDNNCE